MTEATTTTCGACGGRGFRGVGESGCVACNGTGIETARQDPCDSCGGRGKVLGPLDEIQTCGVCDGTGDYWTPPSFFDAAPEVLDPRDATIAALRIERDDLLARVEELSGVADSRNRWKYRAELLEVECREMRERASRQNHLLDEAKAKRDELKGIIDDYRQSRDLREEAAKLLRERLEANARAEAYLAVIRAKDEEIAAITANWQASMKVGVAMAEAGIRFRHVSTETTVEFVQEEQCEKSDERS